MERPTPTARRAGGRHPAGRRLLAVVPLLLLTGVLASCHGGPHNLSLVVDTTTDGGDANPGDAICEMTVAAGDCSLRAAVDEANAETELVPVITIQPGTYVLTLDGADDANAVGDLDLAPPSGYVVLASPDLKDVVVDADGNDGAFDVRSGVAAFGGLAVTGGADAGVTIRSGASSTFGWSAAHHNTGAGITNLGSGVLRTVNSTISTNGNGGIRTEGWIDVDFSTVTQNTGGGIVGFAHLRASIVADQVSGANCTGGAFSNGYSLDTDMSCVIHADHPTDINADTASLLPLSSDPVPFHEPAQNSLAIDAVPHAPGSDCASLDTDQRGAVRPTGPACDIGAIDVTRPTLDLVVDTAVDAGDTTPGDTECDIGDGTCSLRAAIDETNATPSSDAITIAPGINPTLTIAGAGEDDNATGDLDITESVTVDGGGATIDANGLDRGIDVHGHTVSLTGLSITGGSLSEPGARGGGIRTTESRFAFFLGALTDNQVNGTSARGGGISVQGDLVRIQQALISGNAASGAGAAGGGFASLGAASDLVSITISGNDAPDQGAIAQEVIDGFGFLHFTLSTMSGNGGTTNMAGDIESEASILEAGPSSSVCAAIIISNGWNLASDASCVLDEPTDQENVDALIDPLAGNGGPTLTHLPAAGSPAIDGGPLPGEWPCQGDIPPDQRGVARPQGTNCDVGAVEQ